MMSVFITSGCFTRRKHHFLENPDNKLAPPPGSVIAKIQSLKYICFKRLKEYFLYEHAKPIV